MPKLILCKGLPASGKSTWAKAYVKTHPKAVRICRDDLRLMLKDVQFDRKIEGIITQCQYALMDAATEDQWDIVLDATNLNPKYNGEIGMWANANIYEMEWKDFTHVPLSECIERDSKRGAQSVGKKVITQMWRQFLREDPVTPVYDPTLPMAVVCDVDGTVALMGSRNPYDASTADKDTVNESVACVIRLYADWGFSIVYCSGRDAKWRDLTINWLKDNDLWRGDARLLMRPEGDNREDSIVKRELYEGGIAGRYNVRMVLDDRTRVVEMWRDLGLPTWQVAQGDF